MYGCPKFYVPALPHLSLFVVPATTRNKVLEYPANLQRSGGDIASTALNDVCFHVRRVDVRIGKCVVPIRIGGIKAVPWSLEKVLAMQSVPPPSSGGVAAVSSSSDHERSSDSEGWCLFLEGDRSYDSVVTRAEETT